MAWVEKTPFGLAVERDLGNFDKHHKGTKVCQKIVMDTHAHIVVWVQKDYGKSIKQMAQGFRTGITQVARELSVWPVDADAGGTGATRSGNNDATAGEMGAKRLGNNDAIAGPMNATAAGDEGLEQDIRFIGDRSFALKVIFQYSGHHISETCRTRV